MPIIFVYGVTGDVSEHTKRMIALAVNTAAKFNDHVILLLFGQKSVVNINVLDNVEIVEIYKNDDPLQQAFVALDVPVYKHRSSNSLQYELFCLRRWFGLLAFLDQRKLEHAIVVDNDVLLLSNVTRDVEKCYVGCKTFGNRIYTAYLRTEVVRDLISFFWSLYREEPSTKLDALHRNWGVISDMTMLIYFNDENAVGKYCINAMTPLKSELRPRAPFDGTFYEYNYFQEKRLQMPIMTRGDSNKGPHLFQNLHFQSFRKDALVRCPELKMHG